MTSPRPPLAAESFRSAIESGDFASAGPALAAYVATFHSGHSSVEDVSHARSLVQLALDAVIVRRAKLAHELAELMKLQTGYRRPRISNTWALDG
jgi:hypothetical protein